MASDVVGRTQKRVRRAWCTHIWTMGTVTGLALATLSWQGFVVSVLWGWFLVPLQVPVIGVPHAIGLLLLLRLVRGRHGSATDWVVHDLDRVAFELGIGCTALALGVSLHWLMGG